MALQIPTKKIAFVHWHGQRYKTVMKHDQEHKNQTLRWNEIWKAQSKLMYDGILVTLKVSALADKINTSLYRTRSKFQDLPKLIMLWVCFCTKIVILVCVVHFPRQLWWLKCETIYGNVFCAFTGEIFTYSWNVIKWNVADLYFCCFLKSGY